jgi:uncharacterized protein YfaA (DUF2138 family)
MKLTRKKIALTAAAFLILAIALATVQAMWRPFGGNAPPLQLRKRAVGFDIRYPDALIDSAALSRLPADMIRMPFLRSLLTRDFVDYYESTAARLSAEGTLRRLAFEHDLDWRDELIKHVFDEPSRVLLWRSPNGRLGYWVMAIQRNSLAKLMQAVGNVAADDSQLRKVAALAGDVPVYALKLAVGHTLLFAAKGDHLLIISEPGILLDMGDALISDRAEALAQMLDDGGNQAIQSYRLDSSGNTNTHRLVVSVNYLSFGYQIFFPDMRALRFDFAASSGANSPVQSDAAADAGGVWRTAALIEPAHLPQHWNHADVWRALPANAAACASLPVNWSDAADLLGKLGDAEQAAAQVLRAQVAGPAGVCWYAKSSLVAPVFIARLDPQTAQDPAGRAGIKNALASAFGDAIGAYEVKADTASADGAHSSGQSGYRRLPVETRELPGGITLWTRAVSARSGTALSASSPYASRLAAPRYFPVTLALAHGYMVFSPDARLVDDTLAVLDKRYPAVADTIAPPRLSTVMALITPAAAAALIEREAGRALPEDREAIFRSAARTHLLPKLRSVAAYPPLTLSLPAALPASAGWVPVEWHFETPIGEGPRGDEAAARPLGSGSMKNDAGGASNRRSGNAASSDFDGPDVHNSTSGN